MSTAPPTEQSSDKGSLGVESLPTRKHGREIGDDQSERKISKKRRRVDPKRLSSSSAAYSESFAKALDVARNADLDVQRILEEHTGLTNRKMPFERWQAENDPYPFHELAPTPASSSGKPKINSATLADLAPWYGFSQQDLLVAGAGGGLVDATEMKKEEWHEEDYAERRKEFMGGNGIRTVREAGRERARVNRDAKQRRKLL